MKKDELKAKLESGNYYLAKQSFRTGTWSLVDKRTGISCAGRINPRTAESFPEEYKRK